MGKKGVMLDSANMGFSDDAADPNQIFNLSGSDVASGDFAYVVINGADLSIYDGDDGDAATGGIVDDVNLDWAFNGDSSGSILIFGGAAEITFDDLGAWSYAVVDSSLFDFSAGPLSEVVTVTILGSTASTSTDASDTITFNVTCFTRGVMIATEEGEMPIEDLKAGDMIQSLDGPQPISWIGSRKFNRKELEQNPKLFPVKISKNALGPNIPSGDLLVSPQHRILLRSKIVERMFTSREILTPAIKLSPHPDISQVNDVADVEYFHIMTPKHTAIFSNNCPSESLFLGSEARKILSQDSLDELESIFPDILLEGAEMQEARPFVQKKGDIASMVTRHLKNDINMSY